MWNGDGRLTFIPNRLAPNAPNVKPTVHNDIFRSSWRSLFRVEANDNSTTSWLDLIRACRNNDNDIEPHAFSFIFSYCRFTAFKVRYRKRA
jgi:hypothetical protein